MAVSDRLLKEAEGNVLANSTDYNTNLQDIEDALLAAAGGSVITGGVVSISSGITISITAIEVLIGIKLAHDTCTILLNDNATNVLWAVVDPDLPDRMAYRVLTDATIPARAAKISTIVTAAGAITSIDDTVRYPLPNGAGAVAQEVKKGRGSAADLDARLDVGIFDDGKLKSQKSYVSVALPASGVLTLSAAQYDCEIIRLTGTPTGAVDVDVPVTSNAGRRWFFDHAGGAHGFVVSARKAGGGSSVVLKNGCRTEVWTDGTSLFGGAPVPSADGLVANSVARGVRLVMVTNHGRSGLANIDSVTPVAGDRILLAGQTTTSQNGIYVAASGTWVRANDAFDGHVVAAPIVVAVDEGTVYGKTMWRLNTTGNVTLGTTSHAWELFHDPRGEILPASITVGAEAGDIIDVDIYQRDGRNTNVVDKFVTRVWLSDASAGAETATTPSVSMIVQTGVQLQVITANEHLICIHDGTAGLLKIRINHVGAITWWINVERGGRIASAQVVFA